MELSAGSEKIIYTACNAIRGLYHARGDAPRVDCHKGGKLRSERMRIKLFEDLETRQTLLYLVQHIRLRNEK
jgi:hypothetical protein